MIKFVLASWIVFTAAFVQASEPTPTNPFLTKSPSLLVEYFITWKENGAATKPEETNLFKMNPAVNVINLAFVRPDMSYDGGDDISGTGLDYNGELLRATIKAMKAKHKGLKILVSVGGWGANWDEFDPDSIAQFVQDFGMDGVDLDYEPFLPRCHDKGTTTKCHSDKEYKSIIEDMRKAMPQPLGLSIAAWSTGAYGYGEYKEPARGSLGAGELVSVLQKDAALIDMINIMSYNANHYDPALALEAYRKLYQGPITFGIMIPPEDISGHVISPAEIKAMTAALNASNGSGFMIWPAEKEGSSKLIDEPHVVAAICENIKLKGCKK